MIHDRHKKEMAEFLKDIKSKENNRQMLLESAPEPLRDKLLI